MPNHVDNRLTVTGGETELKQFISATHLGENEYDFNKLVPLDPRASKKIVNIIKETGVEQVFSAFADADTDGFDGYNHACQMWGSKWGAYDIQPSGAWHQVLVNGDYRDVAFTYNSAWSPAGELMRRISAQFPTLSFGTWYTEEGMGFCGWELYKDGELIGNGSANMDNLPNCDWEDDESMEKYDQAMDVVFEKLESELEEATMELSMGQ